MVRCKLNLKSLATAILLLQFLFVPGLEDIQSAGKLFVFIFFVLLGTQKFILNNFELRFSQISIVFVFLFFLFFVSSIQAFSPSLAFIQTLIFASIVCTDLKKNGCAIQLWSCS